MVFLPVRKPILLPVREAPLARGGLPWDPAGGGAAPPTPDKIPNLTQWWRETYADGVWTNKVAGGVNTTQGTGSAKPGFSAADASFNNQSALSFDGSDRLDAGAVGSWNYLHDGTGSTVLVVARYTAAGNQVVFDNCNATGTNIGACLRFNAAAARLHYIVANGTALIVNDTTSVIAGSTTYVIVVRFLEGGGTDWTVRMNGAQTASGTTGGTPSGSNATADLAIGARSTSIDQNLTGGIAELAFWSRSLSDAEVTGQLSAYTTGRYGIAA